MGIIERITTKPGYKLLFVAGCFLLVGHIEADTDHKIETVRQEIRTEQVSRVEQYEAFLKRWNHPTPAITARAIDKVAKKPRVMLALTAQEQAGPKTVGKKKEKGQGQVIEKHWGKVPSDPAEQIMQSEAILDELVESTGSLEKGLARYNGSKRYAKSVLAKLLEAP